MTATHRWTTVSSHHTSEGPVRYQRCGCGAWRALYPGRGATSEATSSIVGHGPARLV